MLRWIAYALTLLAAFLINTLAVSSQIAGTVNTHLISCGITVELFFFSSSYKWIFRHSMDLLNTVRAGSSLPVSSCITVASVNPYEMQIHICVTLSAAYIRLTKSSCELLVQQTIRDRIYITFPHLTVYVDTFVGRNVRECGISDVSQAEMFALGWFLVIFICKSWNSLTRSPKP